MPPATAVVYDAADAALLSPGTPALALTPDARARLKELGVPHLTTLDACGEYGHRRIMARVRRAERRAFAALDGDPALGPAARETFRGLFHLYAAAAARLWETLRGPGPWLVPSDGGWSPAATRADAFRLALAHIVARQPSDAQSQFEPALKEASLPAVLRLLNDVAAASLAGGRTVVITLHEIGFLPLEERLPGEIPATRTVHVLGSRGRWADWAYPLRTLANGLRGRPEAWLVAVPGPAPQAQAAARRAAAACGDQVLVLALERLGGLLSGQTALTQGLVEDIERLFAAARPAALLSCSLRWLTDAATAEAARRLAIPITLISHGSHLPPDSATSAYALRAHSRGLLTSPLADLALMQTPYAEAAALRHDPASAREAIRPVMWGYKPLPAAAKTGQKVILHAGTYKAWGGFRPWMYETADEFVAGLAALVEAVAERPDVRLVIRIRSLPELTLESLRALLPPAPNCEIRTTGFFLEDLAGASLLASYSSTTIEEALNLGKPVILWGGTPRYRPLPDTPDARPAVYAPRTAEQLRADLAAALASPTEAGPAVNPHAWPPQTPGPDEFLSRFLLGKG